MQYLCGTRDLTLTLELNRHPNWWVDSSYAVHPDMRSHSGIVMSLRNVLHTQPHVIKSEPKKFYRGRAGGYR